MMRKTLRSHMTSTPHGPEYELKQAADILASDLGWNVDETDLLRWALWEELTLSIWLPDTQGWWFNWSLLDAPSHLETDLVNRHVPNAVIDASRLQILVTEELRPLGAGVFDVVTARSGRDDVERRFLAASKVEPSDVADLQGPLVYDDAELCWRIVNVPSALADGRIWPQGSNDYFVRRNALDTFRRRAARPATTIAAGESHGLTYDGAPAGPRSTLLLLIHALMRTARIPLLPRGDAVKSIRTRLAKLGVNKIGQTTIEGYLREIPYVLIGRPKSDDFKNPKPRLRMRAVMAALADGLKIDISSPAEGAKRLLTVARLVSQHPVVNQDVVEKELQHIEDVLDRFGGDNSEDFDSEND
jgi:hypothetical protein